MGAKTEEAIRLAMAMDPVGVFDSGVGGISVLAEMRRVLPREDFIFYGDTAHAPYGTKRPEECWALCT